MANENAVRDRSIILVYPGCELVSEEPEKIVGAAVRRIPRDFNLLLRGRRKVAVAICISDCDDEHFRSSLVSSKVPRNAGCIVEVVRTIQQVQDRVAVLARLVTMWSTDN